MNRSLVIAFGIVMMAAAFYLATGTSSQTTADQPRLARAFATALHTTPTLTPTRTPTPVPTATPLPHWDILTTVNFTVSLPDTFRAIDIPEGVTIERMFRGVHLIGLLDLYAFDSASQERAIPSVQVLEVRTTLRPDVIPFGIDDPTAAFETPVPVPLGPYSAFRTVATGATRNGALVRELVYWIPRGPLTWLVIYTSPSRLFESNLPTFEQSIRTFLLRP